MAGELHLCAAHELVKLLKDKTIGLDDIVSCVSGRIAKLNPKLNAFIDPVSVCDDMKESARRIKDKTAGTLYGVPVAIKDNICVEGRLTTCASKILNGFKPPYSATVIERLRGEGAIITGRANMDEFAFGSSCETSCYGPTRNPWGMERIPGGSSGGSAAAVASCLVPAALGSDTGGSIRQPAALCGAVGLKPTYGRVSRYGLVAFASSLDQIGPITRDVEDCALLLGAIAGYDPADSTSVDAAVPDYAKSLVNDVKNLKIGIPKEYFIKGIDDEVKEAVLNGVQVFERLGAKSEDVSLPHTEYAVSAYYIIAPAEASSNLARFDGVQYGLRRPGALTDMYKDTRAQGFGKEAKRRIILGTYVLSRGYYDAYYLKALKVRTKMKEDFEKVFSKDFDCIITPTSPSAAFRIGEKIDDPLSMYLSDIFTIPANLTGIPAISILCGFTKEGLPIGLQILAKPFAEETLLRAAYTFEKNTDFHKMRPRL